jgi:hypothetical protein
MKAPRPMPEAGFVRAGGVACCVCGEHVEPTRIDPVTADLTANAAAFRSSMAHTRCLGAGRISDLGDEFYRDEP